jgi:hypothetical protein
MCSTNKIHVFIKSYDTTIVISDNNNEPNLKSQVAKIIWGKEKLVGGIKGKGFSMGWGFGFGLLRRWVRLA